MCVVLVDASLLFGILYPSYASYKAIRTKNVKEYVKWMMYWIVFGFFTGIETLTDIFISWFPFYYEVKVILVIWLLSPATKGSSMLYRKFVHPMLMRREEEIDEYLAQAKEKGYSTVLHLGQRGVNYATNVIMQTAIKVSALLFCGLFDWLILHNFVSHAFLICFCFCLYFTFFMLLMLWLTSDNTL